MKRRNYNTDPMYNVVSSCFTTDPLADIWYDNGCSYMRFRWKGYESMEVSFRLVVYGR